MSREYWLEDKVPLCIIGGGILGLATGYTLIKKYPGLRILEKNPSVGAEQSGHSSGVIHAGPYYPPSSRKAKNCVRGNVLLYEFLPRYDVPHKKTGKCIIARDARESEKLGPLQRNAQENGVEVYYLSGKEIKEKSREPNITAHSGLFIPSTGVVDAGMLVKTLEQLILRETAPLKSVLTNRQVVGIEPKQGNFIITTENNRGERLLLETEFLINAAGLYTDEIARMINPDNQFELALGRGEYYTFNYQGRPELEVHTPIYFLPEKSPVAGGEYRTLGIHLTPLFREGTLSSTISVGPAAQAIKEKNDYGWSREESEQGREGCKERLDRSVFYEKIQPILNPQKNEGLFQAEDLKIGPTGIWANLKGSDDFTPLRDPRYPNCLHLLGYNSPALTSCFAVAEDITSLI